jgi:hypothetical protein
VALQDQQAARICAEEPVHAKDVDDKALAEVLRTSGTTKNGIRVRRGEGEKGSGRDREGQQAHREGFQRWLAECEIEWAREDVLARLVAIGLQLLDRMSLLDEERRAEVDSGRRWDGGRP